MHDRSVTIIMLYIYFHIEHMSDVRKKEGEIMSEEIEKMSKEKCGALVAGIKGAGIGDHRRLLICMLYAGCIKV